MGIKNGAFYSPTLWVNDQAPVITDTALSATENFVATIKHENLLLNWDFTNAVPTRDLTAAGGHPIAMWTKATNTTATVSSDGLTLSGTVVQTIAFGITPNRDYTVSVLVGSTLSAANLYARAGASYPASFSFGEISLLQSSTTGKWSLSINATTQVTIKTIKLEAGAYSTLASGDRAFLALEKEKLSEIDDNGNYIAPATTRTISIAANAWSGSSAPYLYYIDIDGLRNSDIVVIRADDTLYTENGLTYSQSQNIIYFYVTKKPTAAVSIGIGIIKAQEVS